MTLAFFEVAEPGRWIHPGSFSFSLIHERLRSGILRISH
jgi:hypothetical protein